MTLRRPRPGAAGRPPGLLTSTGPGDQPRQSLLARPGFREAVAGATG